MSKRVLFYSQYLLILSLLATVSFSIKAETSAIQPDGYLDGQGGEIATLAHLRWLSENPAAWDEDWVQTADIDATETKEWNSGKGFRPIGDDSRGSTSRVRFEGKYDGQGHSVLNLYIDYDRYDYIGFFGHTYRASISNLKLDNIAVYGKKYVAGLIGYARESNIHAIEVTGMVFGLDYAGGVVGQSSTSTISSVKSEVNLPGYGLVGGIVGRQDRTTVINSFAGGNISSGKAKRGGGIAGYVSNSIIKNSYSNTQIISSDPSSGLYGKEYNATIENSYFDCELGGYTPNDNDCTTPDLPSFGRPHAFFTQAANFPSWDITSAWAKGVWQLKDNSPLELAPEAIPIFTHPTSMLPNYVAKEDAPFQLQVTAISAENNPLPVEYKLEGAPSWLTIDDSGLLSGTPTHLHANQTSRVAIFAQQGATWNALPSADFAVEATNDKPTAHPITLSLKQGIVTELPLSNWIVDEENGPFEFSISTAPNHATLRNLDAHGNITLETPLNYSGPDLINVLVKDGKHSVAHTITLDIGAKNIPNEFTYYLFEDSNQTIDFRLIANGDQTPSVEISSHPSHGGLSENSPLEYVYQPNEHYFGHDSFTAKVNGQAVVVTLAIVQVVDPITTKPFSVKTNEDRSISIDLSHVIEDPEQQRLSYSEVSADNGAVSQLTDSTFVYTPNAEFSGQDTITFSVNDALRPKVSANIDVTILPINDPPIAKLVHTSTYNYKSIYFKDIAKDIDSNNLSFEISNEAKLGTITKYATYFRYSRTNSEQTGHENITVRVSDGENHIEVPVTLYVTTAPVEPKDYDGHSGTITSLAELRWVSRSITSIDKHWKLGANIDASESRYWNFQSDNLRPDRPQKAAGFRPIANGQGRFFTGTFNGNNYAISNLYMYRFAAQSSGIFDSVENATIENLHLNNVDIEAQTITGGLTSRAINSTIRNVHITGKIQGATLVGGIVADSKNSQLEDVSFSGEIVGAFQVGGIVANLNQSNINHAAVNVTLNGNSYMGGIASTASNATLSHLNVTSTIKGYNYVGGIAGTITDSNINQAVSNAIISGQKFIGGVVGTTAYTSKISNSYVIGPVTGNEQVAGIIGRANIYNGIYPTIENSYSTAKITANKYHSSLSFGSANIEHAFYDCQVGYLDCSQEGAKTTAELQTINTFLDANWQHADAWNQGVWLLENGQYPRLRQHPVPLFTSPSQAIEQISLPEGSALNQSITATPAIANEPLKYTLSANAPNWLTLDEKRGLLSGNPLEADIGESNDVIITVNQGELSNALPPFDLRVENINYPPTAATSAMLVNEGAGQTINLAALINDRDSEDSHTFFVQLPTSGKAVTTVTTQGIATYTTTDPDYVGVDEFYYSVTDGNSPPVSAKVSVIINNINDAPIANDHHIETLQDSSVTLDLNTIIIDPDPDDRHRFSVSQPSSGAGTVTLTGNMATFTTRGEHLGRDSFQYWVTDGHNQTATAVVDVSVTNVNDAPKISGTPDTLIGVNKHYSFIPTVMDPDRNDTHRFTITNKPIWASFNRSTGQLTGTPTEEERGEVTDNITIKVTDQAGLSDTLPSFTLSVEEAKPIAVDDVFTLISNEAEHYTLSVLKNDSHSSDLPISIQSANSNDGVLKVENGQIVIVLEAPLSSVEIAYVIEDELEQTDLAQVILNINRDAEQNKPEIQEPADITVYANSLFTRVQLTPPTANDYQGNPLPAKLLDNYTPLLSGRHYVRWLVEDSQGNDRIETQSIDVFPTVSFPADVTISSNNTSFKVPFILSGEAPYYPIYVPYQVSTHSNSGVHLSESGIVSILEGTTAYLDLAVSASPTLEPTPVMTITLDTEHPDRRLNIGSKNTFTLSTQDQAQPPKVTSRVYQNGQQRRWVENDHLVTFKTIANNNAPNISYHYDWNYQNVTVISENGDELVVDPSQLTEGIHKFMVTVTRTDAPSVPTPHDIYFEIGTLEPLSPSQDSDGDLIPDKQETHADDDLDGIPNYLDASSVCQTIPAYAEIKHRYLAEVEAGLCLRKGTTVANSISSGLIIPAAPDNHHQYIGGVYDFVISGLTAPGQITNVVLPQKLSIPSNAIYRKYLNSVWQDFVDDINGETVDQTLPNGAVSSTRGENGYCPPPATPNTEGSPWQYGLQTGDWCVQLSIRDGGSNDADDLVNGVINDPSGSAAPMSLNRAPIAKNDLFVVDRNEVFMPLEVLTNDTDPDGDHLTITDATILSGLADVQIDHQQLLFSTTEDVIGQVTILYTVSDGHLPATASVTVNIESATKRRSGGSLPLIALLGLCIIAVWRYKQGQHW
ncbi:tandem-95 repeat protein [Vibrio sp. 404]|uniref:Tandem-95 repeat protein n=1 Tax=Vibrio marinisediminis TaxID=2758441 RepID=A0A7W2FMX9_9VIBR|nr:Ig-like domain-containing protein [Vibrio marinisediminis]MBA5761039.1 tandem-95 repeat protein [Vibrio marinisediminis]